MTHPERLKATRGEEIMKINKKTTKGITRRDALKVSGLGLVFGGLAMTGTTASNAIGASSSYPPGVGLTDKNSYLTRLKRYVPGTEPVETKVPLLDDFKI